MHPKSKLSFSFLMPYVKSKSRLRGHNPRAALSFYSCWWFAIFVLMQLLCYMIKMQFARVHLVSVHNNIYHFCCNTNRDVRWSSAWAVHCKPLICYLWWNLDVVSAIPRPRWCWSAAVLHWGEEILSLSIVRDQIEYCCVVFDSQSKTKINDLYIQLILIISVRIHRY